MTTSGVIISGVKPFSIASHLGIKKGDCLLALNGRPVQDLIDYEFETCDSQVTLKVRKADGEERELGVEKEPGEELGLEFTEATFDGMRECENRCLFCFIDQMPRGLRPSLYLKDDDWRHSLLHGNFITLTNLEEADWQRIKDQRVSPLYVSIHTINPGLRAAMMGNRRAARIMEDLRRLASLGVTFHGQIVLVPGVNDGAELARTLEELADLWPNLQSVGVVPVGITHEGTKREGLIPLSPAGAAGALDSIGYYQGLFLKKLGSRLVYGADELYLLAGRPLPPAEEYEDFSQVENGIGLTRLLLDDVEYWEEFLPQAIEPRRVLVVTGIAIAPLLDRILNRVSQRVQGLKPALLAVPNRFFGSGITVTGLLTAEDILSSLQSYQEEAPLNIDCLLLSRVMLRQGEEVFLDGLALNEMEERTGYPVLAVDNSGKGLLEGLVGQSLVGDADLEMCWEEV